MMKCPNCGWSYCVLENCSYLDEANNILYRTYICGECNHTFDTQQKMVKIFEPISKEEYIERRRKERINDKMSKLW